MLEREPSILGGPRSGDETAVEVSDPRVIPRPSRRLALPLNGPTYERGSYLRNKVAERTFYVAGFWRRLAAATVDLAIILPVSLLLAWLAGTLASVHLPPSRYRGIDFWLDLLLASDPALVGTLGLTMAIAAVYVMVFQITLARTPGMRLLKTRIIDLYGDPPSTGRAIARTAGYVAGVATLSLGFLWIGFDSEKRGLHDWLSGTYVIKA